MLCLLGVPEAFARAYPRRVGCDAVSGGSDGAQWDALGSNVIAACFDALPKSCPHSRADVQAAVVSIATFNTMTMRRHGAMRQMATQLKDC